jgi:hypothetical protein
MEYHKLRYLMGFTLRPLWDIVTSRVFLRFSLSSQKAEA